MDLANVNFSGPERGLFDVLLGTNKQAEEKDGPGEGFLPLMEMIKAMSEQSEGSSRTDEETAPGKDAIDYRTLINPGYFPVPGAQSPPAPVVSEEAAAAAVMAQGSAADSMAPALGTVDAELVNGMLREKSLPTLSPEEMKLLEQVNAKVAEVNAEGAKPSADVQNLLADINQAQGTGLGAQNADASAPAETPAERQFAKELARKGVDGKPLRGDGEPSSTATKAAEKFVSTESFLQMQKQGGAKAKGEAETTVTEAGREFGKGNVAQATNVTAQAVAEKGSKGKDLLGGAEKELLKQTSSRGEEKADMAAPFSAGLLQSLKGEGNVKEVFLNGTSAQAVKAELLGEVSQGVNLTALKGGGEMRIVIRPDGLGEVKLKVEAKDGKIGVHLTADNDEVAKVLKGGSQELESSLRDQSLSLAKFEVAVKADAPVVATDTSSRLSDQFLGDQRGADHGWNQGFAQGRNEQGFGGWGEGRQERQASPAVWSDETGSVRNNRYAAPRTGSANGARDSSRRLNVVA